MSILHFTHAPLAATLLFAVSLPSHAAAGSAPDVADAQTLDRLEVVGKLQARHATSASTATRTTTPLKDVPQSISAVTAEELQERNARSVNEALETVPGVSQTMGEGRRDQVNIRGFSALFDQYLDGFRDDTPYYRDLGNVERIEVLRGPASVLYGRGTGGGLVNRVSKKPRFGNDIGEISLAAGTHGFLRGTFDVGRSSGEEFAWRFNAAAESSGSFREHYSRQRQMIAPATTWRVGNGVLTAQAEVLKDRRLPDRGIPGVNGRPAAVDTSTYYGDPARDRMDNEAAEARVSWLAPVSERWQLRVAAVGNRVDGEFYNTYVNKPSADGVTVERGQYNSDNLSRDGFGQIELLGDIGGGSITHTLLLGIEAGHQQRDSLLWRGTAANVALVDPDLGVGSVAGTTLSTDRAFTGNSAGIYVQDQMAFGEQWKALVGARWDYFSQNLQDHLGAAPLARTDDKFSPRAGLAWQPNTHHSFYGAWSRSFQSSGDGFSLATNTADLEPEQSTLKEIGWKAEWLEGGLTAAIAVFDQGRDGLRTIDPADPTRLIQVGRQRSRGAEFEVGGTLGERLDLRLGYTHLNTEIVRSNDSQNGESLQGNRPSNVPGDSASLWGTYALGHGFDIGLGVFAVGNRFSANDNLVTLPGYVRADALLRWREGAHEIALNLRNLGDITYYETAHSTHQIMPGAPRTTALTWRMAF